MTNCVSPTTNKRQKGGIGELPWRQRSSIMVISVFLIECCYFRIVPVEVEGVIRLFIGHMYSAVERGTWTYTQNRSTNVGTDASPRENLDSTFSFNVAKTLTVNFDFTRFNLSVYNGVFANDKIIRCGN